MSRHRYPIEACRVFERTNLMKLKSALACSDPANESNNSEAIEGIHDGSEDGGDGKSKIMPPSTQETNRKNQPNKTTIKSILGEALSYGPALSEHIILDAGLVPNMKVGENINVKISDEHFEVLAQAVTRFEDWLENVISGPTIPEGYILMQSKGTGKKEPVVTPEHKVDKVKQHCVRKTDAFLDCKDVHQLVCPLSFMIFCSII